jgi:hypothetical protein
VTNKWHLNVIFCWICSNSMAESDEIRYAYIRSCSSMAWRTGKCFYVQEAKGRRMQALDASIYWKFLRRQCSILFLSTPNFNLIQLCIKAIDPIRPPQLHNSGNHTIPQYATQEKQERQEKLSAGKTEPTG